METALQSVRRNSRIWAIASFLTFWMVQYSPFIAMAAVSKTRNCTGWPRRLAVAAALLCTAYTLVLAILMVSLYLALPRG